jgi:hypothetical protein
MHYAFIDGKRVSRHAVKDCRTFLKLQEAVVSKQAEARRQGHDGNTSSAPQQISKQQTKPRKGRISQIRETRMMEDISHLNGTSAQ